MIPRLHRSIAPTDSPYRDFAAELTLRGFQGDIADGYGDRTVQATDNSIYQVVPQLTLYPRGPEDLVRIGKAAAEPRFRALKLYPRGGDTGTNGQSLGGGVVVDVSRHMNRILEIDPGQRWARVQAGVVKDQLNQALKPHGLFFSPELSTSNRATIGGMVNTDASGQGSVLYGKTRDHVLAIDAVLADGTPWRSEKLDDDALARIQARDDRIGAIHREVDRVQRDNADTIKAVFPPLNRCLTGYDLAHIRDDRGRFDLNSVLCGSEGSLAFIAEVKVNLLPIPRHSVLICVRYASFDAALRDAPRLMKLEASSIETIDSTVIKMARGDTSWEQVREFFPEGPIEAQGINLIEFIGDDEAVLEDRLAAVLQQLGQGSGNGPHDNGPIGHTVARGEDAVRRVWAMRKKAVGLLGNISGSKRPIPFMEDTAVPPEHLADYIAELRALLDSHGLFYGMFGHVDAGVLHVRPAFDMKEPGQMETIRRITDGVAALTAKYRGLLWGEHGKGMRSEYVPAFFGPLYPSLQAIKAAFDPYNQMNPGKVAAPPDHALLKLDEVDTRGAFDRTIPPAVRRQFDEALHCNGNGACFNFDPDDPMCPSWKASRDRRFSPKGRASLLREWLRQLVEAGAEISADPPEPGLAALPIRVFNTLAGGRADFSHQVKEAMATCLSCKSCTGQCPIKVDVPEFRSKFLALYHTRYLRPLKDHLVCMLEPLLPWLAHLPGLVNAMLRRQALMHVVGLTALPELAPDGTDRKLAAQGVPTATPAVLAGLTAEQRDRTVVVVQDAFTRYFETGLVVDLFTLLRTLGFRPLLAPYRPNGKPLHIHGFRRRFARTAQANAEMLSAIAAMGLPLVGLEPAMTLTYRDEYRKALPEAALPKVQLLQEWLASVLDRLPAPPKRDAGVYRLLAHCTEKTTVPTAGAAWRKIFAHFGARLDLPASGCCGMAGTYGHTLAQRAASETIYRQSWGRLVAAADDTQRLLATGYSCRCQVKHIDAVALPHPVQALLALCRSESAQP